MKRRICNAILCFVLILGMVFDGNISEAKVQKKHYYTCLTQYSGRDVDVHAYKANFSGNRMIIWGSWRVNSNGKKLYKGKKLKSKKRTFILASNCKCYSTGGQYGAERISKKAMKGAVENWYNGVGLFMTVKNGKVIKMELAS